MSHGALQAGRAGPYDVRTCADAGTAAAAMPTTASVAWCARGRAPAGARRAKKSGSCSSFSLRQEDLLGLRPWPLRVGGTTIVRLVFLPPTRGTRKLEQDHAIAPRTSACRAIIFGAPGTP